MLAKSPLFLVAFLEVSIALLLALLVVVVAKLHRASGRPLTDVVNGFIRRARAPLQSLLIATAFVVLLNYILPKETMTPSSVAVFLVFFSALAIVPPWLPTRRLFATAAVAFYVACAVAFIRLLPTGSSGPDAMGVSILLCVFWLLFFGSCAARLVFKAASSHSTRRARHQQAVLREESFNPKSEASRPYDDN
jgi:hypothetical protein